MNKQYIRLIADLKQSIVQSRYVAARLANKEQLLLYFKTGKMLAEKIAAEKWGVKIVEQIAEDLQKQLPGLRGFSYRNLMNMRSFILNIKILHFCSHQLHNYETFVIKLSSIQKTLWKFSPFLEYLLLIICLL